MDTSNMTPEELERYNYKMSVCHSGPCTSPYRDNCPCPNDCPLHGRCCDCIHLHIKNRRLHGGDADDYRWLPECVKLSKQGKFDNLYINDSTEKGSIESDIDTSNMNPMELEHFNAKLRVSHQGPCSSPYYEENCPCTIDCPLHGRCCDCVHHHLDGTISNGGVKGFAEEHMLWMTACLRLTHQGPHDEVFVHERNKE